MRLVFQLEVVERNRFSESFKIANEHKYLLKIRPLTIAVISFPRERISLRIEKGSNQGSRVGSIDFIE